MKALVTAVTFTLLSVGCGKASSMSCGQFNALANTTTQQHVSRSKATSEQFDAFKTVIAHHAGTLASINRFSDRNRTLQLARNNNQLGWLMGNSLEMTRSFCIGREGDKMKDVAIEQFNFLLDAMANSSQ